MKFATIPFGLDSAGVWRNASEVPRGLDCGCVCPECGNRLVARQGEVLVHHFAHHSRSDCRNAAEAGVLGMILRLFREGKASLRLPSYLERVQFLDELDQDIDYGLVLRWLDHDEHVFPSQWISNEERVEARAGEPVADQFDLFFPDLNVGVHLLHSRKPPTSLAPDSYPEGVTVVWLDVKRFVKRWLETCDPDPSGTVRLLSTATDSLLRWLASDNDREIICHGETEQRIEKFLRYYESQQEKQRQRLEAERQAERLRKEARQPLPPPSVMAPAAPQPPPPDRPPVRTVLPATLPPPFTPEPAGQTPGTVLAQTDRTCRRCGGPVVKVVLGHSHRPYTGRTGWVCTADPDHHPFGLGDPPQR